MSVIDIYGAGLAGCEAAYQASRMGIKVFLHEMKPRQKTPAHSSDLFAELVCSNSLRSDQIFNAVGLLKEEMRRMGSLIMEAADANRVEAGSSLAVDRNAFSSYITEKIKSDPNITLVSGEVTSFENRGIKIIATGPLTTSGFSDFLGSFLGIRYLSFYDASAPIIDAQSIDMSKVYALSRYEKGEAAYLNCPLNIDEYTAFYSSLINANQARLHDVDSDFKVFEGCMPVEVMAKRGLDTLRFGPMKPVGLPDPKTGVEPYAVVQLRQENTIKSMYNLVGFQTHLTIDSQKEVFSMIPGLENAQFLRYGVMHRNTFIDSPRLLAADYSLRQHPNIFFAGQITGVEGYVESASAGLLAGINASLRAKDKEPLILPKETIIGALAAYISDPNVTHFQPMNANFGLAEPPQIRIKGGKRAKTDYLAKRSLSYFEFFRERNGVLFENNS